MGATLDVFWSGFRASGGHYVFMYFPPSLLRSQGPHPGHAHLRIKAPPGFNTMTAAIVFGSPNFAELTKLI